MNLCNFFEFIFHVLQATLELFDQCGTLAHFDQAGFYVYFLLLIKPLDDLFQFFQRLGNILLFLFFRHAPSVEIKKAGVHTDCPPECHTRVRAGAGMPILSATSTSLLLRWYPSLIWANATFTSTPGTSIAAAERMRSACSHAARSLSSAARASVIARVSWTIFSSPALRH